VDTSMQNLFDTVAKHLLTQKKQAFKMVPTTDGKTMVKKCLYRADDGSKCAVGCLIRDDLYTPSIEGSFWNKELHKLLEASLGRTLDIADLNMLSDLQSAHDSLPPDAWPSELKNLAGKHGLTFNEEVPAT